MTLNLKLDRQPICLNFLFLVVRISQYMAFSVAQKIGNLGSKLPFEAKATKVWYGLITKPDPKDGKRTAAVAAS